MYSVSMANVMKCHITSSDNKRSKYIEEGSKGGFYNKITRPITAQFMDINTKKFTKNKSYRNFITTSRQRKTRERYTSLVAKLSSQR